MRSSADHTTKSRRTSGVALELNQEVVENIFRSDTYSLETSAGDGPAMSVSEVREVDRDSGQIDSSRTAPPYKRSGTDTNMMPAESHSYRPGIRRRTSTELIFSLVLSFVKGVCSCLALGDSGRTDIRGTVK